MKKSGLIISHLFFWVFTTLSGPYVFSVSFMFLALRIQQPGPPTGLYGTYELEIHYPTLLIFMAVGACIFYASYFSLNFFVKRPIRFISIFVFYAIYELVFSLPANLISEQASRELGPVVYFNLCGFLFKACVEWLKDKKIKIELEKDRDASQLELLQSKIDSHFLFNNLNNIDVFIQEDPKLASDYLKKLSDILRFMLYEANSSKVPLQKEIEYIHKYVDLQRIRTSNPNFVTFKIQGDVINKFISPMILIHFIENAFKYAANKKIEEAVSISFEISGGRLVFYCKNHISSANEHGSVKKGLGINLLKQKLDLIYKKEYILITKEENNWYIVKLDIRLDED
jgi:sensor histidine kinase YesM